MDADLAIRMTADASDAAGAFDDVGDRATAMAREVDSATGKADTSMSGLADSADSLGSSTSQAAGGLGDLGGALSAVPGPLGSVGSGMESLAPLVMGVTGATDLMNLAMNSSVVVTAKAKAAAVGKAVADKAMAAASKVAAVAQWALNAAMSANPIGLVVIAVAALVAAIVLAYNKSETFRSIVKSSMDVAKGAVQAVVGVVKDVKERIGDAVDKLPGLSTAFGVAKTLIVGYIELVTLPMRTLLGVIKDVVEWISDIKFPEPPGWLKDLPGVPGGRSATGAGLTGSLSADLRGGNTPATGGGNHAYINLQTLDLRGTGLRDLIQALRREGFSVGEPVRST